MKLIFYGNRKSLIAIMICAVLLSGSHVAHATNEPEPTYSSQQTGKIKGTVTDTNGETVIGASIVLKGTTNGTITDMDGNFTLSDVPAMELSRLVLSDIKHWKYKLKDRLLLT